MKIFRKLVRDRIPEMMMRDGKRPVTRILDDAEYVTALENKLLEEVQELRLSSDDADSKKMEIADIYEVLDALIQARGFSKEEIFSLQQKKQKERGGFEKKIFLEGTEE